MMSRQLQWHNIIRTVYLFFQFFKRDLYIYSKNLKDDLINYVIMYPLLFALAYIFIQTKIYFPNYNPKIGAIMFSGNIIINMMVLTYKKLIPLLFDLENDRFIDYQISILNPRLVLLQRIFSIALWTFLLCLPFFPIGKLILQNNLDTTNAHWFMLLLILFLSSFCCAAYHMLAICILKNTNQIIRLWARFNFVLINFGGLFFPWYIMREYSSILGYLAYLNPLIYVSDGIRQAMIGGNEFLSLSLCISMLSLFSFTFVLLGWRVFKKRVDHI